MSGSIIDLYAPDYACSARGPCGCELCELLAEAKQLQSQLAAEQEDNKGLREELAFFDATASQEASEMWSVVLLEREKNKWLHDSLEVCEGCGNTTKIDDENYLLWCKTCWEKVVFENKRLREELAFFDATASQEASEMWSIVLLERKENKRMREAIKETLEENAHLADGDVCTLFKLKQSLKGENEPDGKGVVQ